MSTDHAKAIADSLAAMMSRNAGTETPSTEAVADGSYRFTVTTPLGAFSVAVAPASEQS